MILSSILPIPSNRSRSAPQALQAFRLLRILRTVRIFRAYKNFRRLMDSILHGLVSLREFLLLLGICIFIFAVLGMQVGTMNSRNLPQF